MAKLIFKLDDGQEIVVPLSDRITIGRVEGNDVVVDDRRISSKHAAITRNSEGLFAVEDLGSKGGTFVNGERVVQSELSDGDEISFGPLRGKLVLEQEDRPVVPAAKTPPAPVLETAKPRRSAPVRAAVEQANLPGADELSTPQMAGEISQKLLQRLGTLQKDLGGAEATLRSLHVQRDETQALLTRLFSQRDEAESTLREQTSSLAKLRNEANLTEARLNEMNSRIQAGTEDEKTRSERLAILLVEETRLAGITKALAEGEERKTALDTGIVELSTQYGEKVAALDVVQKELATATEARDAALSLVDGLAAERDILEPRLAKAKEELEDVAEKTETLHSLVEAREDQTKILEKNLQSLEQQRVMLQAHITELSGSEAHLVKVHGEVKEAEANRSTLDEILTALAAGQVIAESRVAELQTEITSLEGSKAEAEAGLAASQTALAEAESNATAFQTSAESRRQELEAEKAALETSLATCRQELDDETTALNTSRTEREELARQCEELAGTDVKLAETHEQLDQAEARRAELTQLNETLDAQQKELEATIASLTKDHETLQGQMEVLRGRETDLRKEIASLSEREEKDRARFEEISGLSADAEKEFADQTDRIAKSMALSTRELADLELKLTPLRQWKEEMDKRYERLASLPEDSAEARDLWREIESEKSNLAGLMTKKDGDTRGITLNSAVLRGISSPEDATEERTGSRVQAPGPGKSKLHAPEGVMSADTPEERGNVGHTGTGAMLSGTGQEMALKARVTRLRESVQREATRLEFLRQERAREETRKQTSGGGESLLKEHERQLEIKIRREEEHLATIQRKLELAEVEEERRREKIAEMEYKLSELRADIAEAERDQRDARHQAGIAHVEQQQHEERVEVEKPRDQDGKAPPTSPAPSPSTAPVPVASGGVLAAIINSTKSRSAFNLKPMGTPKDKS